MPKPVSSIDIDKGSKPIHGADSQSLERGQRLFGYAFWTFAAVALPLAVDRLLIHPILSHELGETRFSALVWVLALISVVGSVGYNGFAILLVRDFASRSEDEGRRLIRTAVLLTTIFSALILATVTLAAWPWMPSEVRSESGVVLVGFVGFGLIRAVWNIFVTHLRIRRRFIWIFTLRAIEAGLLLVNIVFASRQSMFLIVAIYILSVLIPLPVGAYASRDVIGKGEWWSARQSRWLMLGWFSGASITLVNRAQTYSPRLLLGVLGDNFADVGALYAATTIGLMFVFPINILSQLVFSLLGGETHFSLSGRRGWQYLGLTLVFSVAVGVLTYLFGRWLVQMLYPAQSEAAVALFGYIAIANSFLAVEQMLRPVLIKYARLSVTAIWSGLALVVQLTTILLLVPRYEAVGAAAAMAISGLVAAVIWIGYFLRVHNKLSASR